MFMVEQKIKVCLKKIETIVERGLSTEITKKDSLEIERLERKLQSYNRELEILLEC